MGFNIVQKSPISELLCARNSHGWMEIIPNGQIILLHFKIGVKYDRNKFMCLNMHQRIFCVAAIIGT